MGSYDPNQESVVDMREVNSSTSRADLNRTPVLPPPLSDSRSSGVSPTTPSRRPSGLPPGHYLFYRGRVEGTGEVKRGTEGGPEGGGDVVDRRGEVSEEALPGHGGRRGRRVRAGTAREVAGVLEGFPVRRRTTLANPLRTAAGA